MISLSFLLSCPFLVTGTDDDAQVVTKSTFIKVISLPLSFVYFTFHFLPLSTPSLIDENVHRTVTSLSLLSMPSLISFYPRSFLEILFHL